MDKITEFQGRYRWLSNFAPAEVVLDGVTYPTTEHAYQASKFKDFSARERIKAQSTPGGAKRAARKFTPDPDFDGRKIRVMAYLQAQKYAHPYYRNLLLGTGDCVIEEGNKWGDTFWGVCNGKGENNLGKILMDLRSRIRAEE